MLGRASVVAARSSKLGVRQVSGLPSMLYKNVWRKSTGLYLTYIASGCIVLGAVYESFTEGIWRTMNRGVSDILMS